MAGWEVPRTAGRRLAEAERRRGDDERDLPGGICFSL